MKVETKNFEPMSPADLAMLGTGPIPAGPYYQPDYFELERAAVFRRSWLQMGHVCEVPEPGSFIVREIEVANAVVLIVRGKDGKIRSFHNVCTHRGTLLVPEESGKKANFSCRYHMWTYGHDGRLLSAPDFERFGLDKAKCGLTEIATDVCGGLIFLNLDKNPPQSLQEYLGPLGPRLETMPAARATHFAEYVYEINANWKLTYDNFQENYHLRFIHPRSIGSTSMSSVNPFGYAIRFDFYGPHRTQALWYNPDFVPQSVQGAALGALAGFASAEGYGEIMQSQDYFALFPNFFMIGSPVLPFSHCVMPIAADRSRGVIRLYWNGVDGTASRRFAREYAMASVRDIHSEDRAVIEAGHRGLSSGAIDHIHFQTQEALCRHFFNSVDAAVQAYKAERALAEARA